MEQFHYRPIGHVHSPFKEPAGTPIQPAGAPGMAATIELDPRFTAGLKDLEGFSHIIILFHFHQSSGYNLVVKPFLDDHMHGVFATRAPRRPNPIGLSVVKLVRIEGATLHIEELDILDGTPVLDIKPYVPVFDSPQEVRIGWLTNRSDRVGRVKADERFKP